MDRESQIVRTSIVAIIGNIVLAASKGIVGTMTGSIAISLDAINSLADALSSVIAIIGAKLASRSASRDHPFGFGRMEYLSSIVIASLILAAGVSSLIEAVRSIIHPTTPSYTIPALMVVGTAALVKLCLGLFLLRQGKTLAAGALVGSGTDSLMDAGVSTATLIAGILFMATGIAIESILAGAIAILIIKSGIELLIETASKLLGERVDPEIAAKVEREARSFDQVKLASGLVLLDFGPNRLAGSIHLTVDGKMSVAEFDVISREVQKHVQETCGVNLVGVTPYPATSADDDAAAVRSSIGRIVWSHDHVVELRGLYVDPTTSTVRFDAVMEFRSVNEEELHAQLLEACKAEYPDWTFVIRVMPDIGD